MDGQSRFESLDELADQIGLAHTHRVEPDDVAIREGVFEPIFIVAKALAETPAPVAAPEHLQKVKRGRDAKADIKQTVIDESLHTARAPHFCGGG